MTQDMRHDAETFRVAEELMMLSCMATASGSITSGSSFAPTPVAVKRSFHALEPALDDGDKIRHIEPVGILNQVAEPTHGQENNPSDQSQVKARRVRKPTASDKNKHILNTRCDLSHSDLLKEHRMRFRRVRRRWNFEQNVKKRAYLARFEVQGVPLVQHLETLNHWR